MPHPCPAASSSERPKLEVAQIFRAHGAAYRESHSLGPQQRAVMWAIEHCRTETLGGHKDVCTGCGHSQPAYNSCRNRHCPKCQALAQAAWLERRKARILPTHYFHVVFTIPHELNPLCRWNPRAMYDLLFQAASATLLDFGRGELGAQLGITAVLHTWTRDLQFHPHLHCVVTGGGLSQDGERWVASAPGFLFPVHALSKRFRGKLLDGLRTLHAQQELVLGDQRRSLADSFPALLDVLYRTDWVVYCKAPFGGPEQVYGYLGRYTHRVAIANSRLVHLDAEQVCFRTRDGKQVTVTPQVFIGRFLLHLLPKSFVKIRHYGLMASGNATTRLEVARTVLSGAASLAGAAAQPAAPSTPTPSQAPEPVVSAWPLPTLSLLTPPPAEGARSAELLDWQTQFKALTGRDLSVCPRCGGVRIRRPLGILPRPVPISPPSPQDTS